MVKCMSIVGKRSVDIRVMCIICAERMVGGTKTVMGGILTATSVIKLSQRRRIFERMVRYTTP
jgi:hypothetical protein